MRYLILILLAGCASSQASREADTFNAASKEPVCARSCLANYTACASTAGGSKHRSATIDVLNACQAGTRQCLSTCPDK